MKTIEQKAQNFALGQVLSEWEALPEILGFYQCNFALLVLLA